MTAGVQCGDIITAMDGDPVVTVKALHNKLLTFQPGDEVKLSAKDGPKDMWRLVYRCHRRSEKEIEELK